MTINFLIPALHGIDVNNVWFQQDGTTCHTSQATFRLQLDLLCQAFDVHLIRRNGYVNCLPNGYNSILLNYLL